MIFEIRTTLNNKLRKKNEYDCNSKLTVVELNNTARPQTQFNETVNVPKMMLPNDQSLIYAASAEQKGAKKNLKPGKPGS